MVGEGGLGVDGARGLALAKKRSKDTYGAAHSIG